MEKLILDQTFKEENYTATRLPRAEYENCIFEGCDFSKGYLDSQTFLECEFIDCNLSNANIVNTTFKEVTFSHCKLMGLAFHTCNSFLMNFSFVDCNLNFSVFTDLKLIGQLFKACKLEEADFSDCDLSTAKFMDCNLQRTVFSRTNLQKADFSTASNFSIDPENNTIKGAIFSRDTLEGLLHKYKLKILE
ncbi:pentapeptide repeat-containing protein [Maribacter sp. SA7]|uniref:pentapeptide repeat-containing protein n=1 Tax=Maribacter zhoushanensis TaxID=3030012 RepID=UPI0023EADDA1|nr:pentapeptide repeat-containing protein [Maribacter zhoushanensis]MDF4201750.1 pentapeptide repeat-containing protein [Maribacter zhoushanensis]